jgi:excisionase family DNA binding protein
MTTDLLSINEAAPIIGISPCSLRLLIHAGKIRYMRIGPNAGMYRLRREWLAEYLESCIHEPAGQLSAKLQPTIVSITRSSRAKAVVEPQSQKERLKAFRQEHKKRGMA